MFIWLTSLLKFFAFLRSSNSIYHFQSESEFDRTKWSTQSNKFREFSTTLWTDILKFQFSLGLKEFVLGTYPDVIWSIFLVRHLTIDFYLQPLEDKLNEKLNQNNLFFRDFYSILSIYLMFVIYQLHIRPKWKSTLASISHPTL